jgi:lipoprotein-releasing system ATP-binding protein
MTESWVLEAIDVDKSFVEGGSRLEILKALHLVVGAGESLAIVGASGSGKTTLLQCLGGLDAPTAGTVKIAGVDLATLSVAQVGDWRNRHIGFVYQFHHLLPEFSALENVMMPLLIRHTSVRDAKARATELLAKVGLEQRLHHRPKALSGGERQRAALARALVTNPSLVLADEPTGNLDRENAERVLELLLDLNRTYRSALVIVTHDERIAARLGKTVLLEDGKLRPRL